MIRHRLAFTLIAFVIASVVYMPDPAPSIPSALLCGVWFVAVSLSGFLGVALLFDAWYYALPNDRSEDS